MNRMKILLVEDQKPAQQNFMTAVYFFNHDHNLTVEPDIVEDTSSALRKINNSYHGVIIDMRLGNDPQGGNEIVRQLAHRSINVPVIFVTAYPHLIERDPLIIRERSRDDGSYKSDLLLLWQRYSARLLTEKATQTYTALIRESEGWWIGWILEVPGVTCQERTRNELLDTLQITLREILEDETLAVSRRTESEAEAVKASDILEFGVSGASHQTEGGFEEVSIDA